METDPQMTGIDTVSIFLSDFKCIAQVPMNASSGQIPSPYRTPLT